MGCHLLRTVKVTSRAREQETMLRPPRKNRMHERHCSSSACLQEEVKKEAKAMPDAARWLAAFLRF